MSNCNHDLDPERVKGFVKANKKNIYIFMS